MQIIQRFFYGVNGAAAFRERFVMVHKIWKSDLVHVLKVTFLCHVIEGYL